MPTSVPGPSRRRGFTLLELLVVLLVMGLCAGLVGALAQPDERARLQVEAGRLAQLLELAAVEARLTGKPVAWTADAAHYRFWRWSDAAGWSEEREDALRARSLPAGMAISALRVEARRSPKGMRLEFSPHGALAFDLEMSLGAARFTVSASPVGEVRLHAPR
jgi:general secretion pathway protein H